jgi:thiosulfate/3-mercaptopyruvate sulfurtransferase
MKSPMKFNWKYFLPSLMLVILLCASSQAQTLSTKKQVYDPAQLMQTAELVRLLGKPDVKKPLIYNIGFVGNIKGAEKLAPASKEEGLKLLKERTSKLSRRTPIVVYCGCCPFEHCPNVKPAYTMLQEMGFRNAKILDLPTSIKADWIDKGYPMEKKKPELF